jgi:hypothetical protein
MLIDIDTGKISETISFRRDLDALRSRRLSPVEP